MDTYVLSVRAEECAIRVSVNGAPLVIETEGVGVVQTQGVNEWILPPVRSEVARDSDRRDEASCRNRLSVFLYWPAGKPFTPGAARAKVSLFIADPAEPVPTPRRMLASFEWPVADIVEAYPMVRTIPFLIGEPPPTTLWNETQPIDDLTDQDKDAIVDLINRFRATLVPQTDAFKAYDLTSYKFEDGARAEGADPRKRRGMAVVQYAMLEDVPDPVSRPLARQRAVFQKVVEDRAVLVTDGLKDEAIIIRQRDGAGDTYAIDVYVARIGGAWTIVR